MVHKVQSNHAIYERKLSTQSVIDNMFIIGRKSHPKVTFFKKKFSMFPWYNNWCFYFMSMNLPHYVGAGTS